MITTFKLPVLCPRDCVKRDFFLLYSESTDTYFPNGCEFCNGSSSCNQCLLTCSKSINDNPTILSESTDTSLFHP